MPLLPGPLNGPDAERAHVADCPVVFVGVESLWCLEALADPLVHGAVDPLRRVKALLDHTLRASGPSLNASRYATTYTPSLLATFF